MRAVLVIRKQILALTCVWPLCGLFTKKLCIAIVVFVAELTAFQAHTDALIAILRNALPRIATRTAIVQFHLVAIDSFAVCLSLFLSKLAV